ncbi:MAG: phosphate regulon sensor histidine kinase PhoR [Acidiferrobacter sp.]
MTFRLHPAFRRALLAAMAVAAGGYGLGFMFGHAVAGLAAAVCVYGLVQLNRLRRLHAWLVRGTASRIPEIGGLWDEVIREVHRADRDSARHKDRLSGLFDRLQAAASAMPDAMVVLSHRDQIEWANPSAERLLGLHLARDIGTRIVHLIRDPALSAYLDGGGYHEPLILKDSLGPYVASLQIIPFGDSQKLVIGRDITHLIRLEEMRSHFVADVSHELRTPLTVLRGFLESLQEGPLVDDHDLRANLALMHEQAERMQRLVDDLLALSRLETVPPQSEDLVDMPALIAGLRDFAQALSGARHHRIEIEVTAGTLRGNRDELHSAVSNLVSNAIRHTPDEGRITIRWVPCAEGARLDVEDTGEGIAAHHLPYLTERFYRVDSGRSRATGGTGLGLAIVRQILIRHNARLRIDSTVGRGSVFSCLFPPSRLIAAGDRAGS